MWKSLDLDRCVLLSGFLFNINILYTSLPLQSWRFLLSFLQCFFPTLFFLSLSDSVLQNPQQYKQPTKRLGLSSPLFSRVVFPVMNTRYVQGVFFDSAVVRHEKRTNKSWQSSKRLLALVSLKKERNILWSINVYSIQAFICLWPINQATQRVKEGAATFEQLGSWICHISFYHWSQAKLSSARTWLEDCSSVFWVLLLTLRAG